MEIISRLTKDYPQLEFTAGESHCWSPKNNQIFYAVKDGQIDIAGLLHELGHAKLGHANFNNDLDLLQKEIDAWQEALNLAKQYDTEIDENHIQDCLDTYRDWLYQRSRCPACKSTGVQQNSRLYICINCSNKWEVSGSRQKRPYRRSAAKQSTDVVKPTKK